MRTAIDDQASQNEITHLGGAASDDLPRTIEQVQVRPQSLDGLGQRLGIVDDPLPQTTHHRVRLRQPQLLDNPIEQGPQADTGTTGERFKPHLGVDVFEQGRCDRSLSARIPQRRQIPAHSVLSIVNDPPPGKSDTALAPADSRPKTTISIRGTNHFSTVADETSTPIQSRPIL